MPTYILPTAHLHVNLITKIVGQLDHSDTHYTVRQVICDYVGSLNQISPELTASRHCGIISEKFVQLY